MSEERPETCKTCGAPVVWCTCPHSGYFKIIPIDPNIFSVGSLADIVKQLEFCSYRCEAGPLESNLAFIELKRRAAMEQPESGEINCTRPAEFMIYSPEYPLDPSYSCAAHLADMVEDGDVVRNTDIPVGQSCCLVAIKEPD